MTDNNIHSQSLKDTNYPLAYGNRKSIVNAELYSGENLNNKSLVFFLPTIQDRIRARTSNYWFGNELLFQHIPKEKHPFSINVLDHQFFDTKENIWGHFEETIELQANKQLFYFDLVLPPNKTNTYNAEAWRKCITNEVSPDLTRAKIDPGFGSQAERRLETSTSQDGTLERNQSSQQGRVPDVNIGQGSTAPTARVDNNSVLVSQPNQQRQTFSAQDPNFNQVVGGLTQNVLDNQGTIRQIELIKPSFERGKVFYDFIFEVNVPINSTQYNLTSFPIGTKLFDIKPEYNFFVDEYEEVIKNDSVNEKLLPNIYTFLTEMKAENRDFHNTIFSSHISLFGKIDNIFIDVLNERGQKINEKDVGQYFDKFSRKINEFLLEEPEQKNVLLDKFQNQVFPVGSMELIKNFSNKKFQYPMNFEVYFSTDKQTLLSQIVKESFLFSSITKKLINQKITPTPFQVLEITETLQQNRGILTKSFKPENKTLNTWNVSSLLLDLLNNTLDESKTSVLFETNSTETNALEFSSQFIKHLSVFIFSGKLKSILKEKFRTYYDILQGRKCFAETLFYKVDKLDGASKQVIQSFYIPNTGELDVIKLIDTQVKYNKEYIYKIYSYQLVVGNKYKYDLEEVSDEKARLKVLNEPQLFLTEVLYGEETNAIVDDPPISPNVEFIPFRGVDNKIKLFFTNNFDQIDELPILIDEEDEKSFRDISRKQKVEFGNKIHFGTDDIVSVFQVYRIDQPPSSFRSFTGYKIKNIESDLSILTFQKADSAVFIDTIFPNKKYYYMFRAVDVHGNVSNPSPIFELEMVNDGFSVFPTIKTFQFPKQELVFSKPCKRFIQISPAFNQTILNEEKSGLVINGKRADSVVGQQNLHLGIAEQQVWNKTFKIRLVSRKSGKKLDLNVSFIHNSIKEE